MRIHTNARLLATLALVAPAALAHVAAAQGTLEFQVSPALQETWSSSINALPGQAIDIRMRVTYTGDTSVFGFGSVFFQPAISNWDASGPSTDTLLPFRDRGGATTTPIGDVPNSPGVYGRVAPWGWRAPMGANGDNPYTGYHNTAAGVSYLRIAQASASNWIGGAGNTGGGIGINVGQPDLNYITRTPGYPHAYNFGLSHLVVLKLGITLSQDTDLRTLIVSTAEAFSGRPVDYNEQVKWFSSQGDVIPGSTFGDPVYIPATINIVPGPWTGTPLLLLALNRRRR